MTPHEEQYPRRPEPDDNWGMFPFLVGVGAIVLVGVLVLAGNS